MQVIAAGIRKCDGLRMQEQAMQAQFSGRSVGLRITVAFIMSNRMPHVQGMHANLVGTTGQRLALQQAELAKRAGQAHFGPRLFAGIADDDMPLSVLAMPDQ